MSTVLLSPEILGERRNGAIISQDDGNAVAYALWKIQERGRLFHRSGRTYL